MTYYSVTKQSLHNYQRMLCGDFCILCVFPVFIIQGHLTAELSRSDPVDSVYWCVHRCVCSVWNPGRRKFITKLTSTRITFHIWFMQNNKLFSSISNLIHIHY